MPWCQVEFTWGSKVTLEWPIKLAIDAEPKRRTAQRWKGWPMEYPKKNRTKTEGVVNQGGYPKR